MIEPARHNPIPLMVPFLVAALLICGEGHAENWRKSWDATLYFYPEFINLDDGSILNPANSIAKLPESSVTAEARGSFELESRKYRLYLRPIASLIRTDEDGYDQEQLYLNQWQARVSVFDDFAFSVGRQLLNWGPGQFRSPSSPFYFNNGRTNPLRELSGIDDIQLFWSPGPRSSVLIAYVTGSGHRLGDGNPWRDSYLVKTELRRDVWTAGLVVAEIPDQKTFFGGYGQWTISDGWLAYGEFGSGSLSGRLAVPEDPLEPWFVEQPSARGTSFLVGAMYTLTNGQSLSAEYLRYDLGYSSTESSRFFQQAKSAATLPTPQRTQELGTALSFSPDLLRTNYLHLIWQNNMLSGDTYWRLMYSHNLDDNSGETSLYAEHYLSGGLSCYLLGSLFHGSATTEFGSLIDNRLLVGLRLALP